MTEYLSSTASPRDPLPPAFGAVMDAASVAVMATDEAGYYVYSNPAAETLLGYASAELRARHILELHDADPQWFQAEFALLQSFCSWNGRLILRRADGRLLKVAVNAFVNAAPGRGTSYVCLSRPIPIDPAEIGRLRPGTEPRYLLTAAEFGALHLLAEGFSDGQIGGVLGLDDGGLHLTLAGLYGKLGASSRTEACLRALKDGLIV